MERDRLGREVSQALEAARMTAEAASLEAGLARDTVGRWIRGRTVPMLASLRAVERVLSQALDRTVDLSAALKDRASAGQSPVGSADVSPATDAERTYLDALSHRLAEVPSFLRPHGNRAALHVTRSIRRRCEIRKAPWDPTIEGGDIVGTFRLLDAFNHRRPGRLRLLVTAEAGEGKTWWLESVAYRLAHRRTSTGSSVDLVPVLVRFNDVVTRCVGPTEVRTAVIDAALSECGLTDDAAVRSWLDEEWQEHRLVLCLDGADEAHSSGRAVVHSVLRSLDRSQHFVLLTSRPWCAAEVSLSGSTVCELEPLYYDNRKELVQRLGFPADVATRLMSDDDLKREVATPLHLALAWQVSRSDGRLTGHDLPVRMLEIYLAKPWKDDCCDDRGVVAAKLRVLGRVATAAAHPKWADLDQRTYFELVDRDDDRTLAQGADPRSLGEQFLDRLDAVLAITDSPPGAAMRFTHRPFHEGLVAHWLAHTDLPHRVRILDQHEHDHSWTEITRNILVIATPAELDELLGRPEQVSRARLRAAAEAARTSERVAEALQRVASMTTAALAFSPAASDRRLADLLRSVIKHPGLEWEHLVANAYSPSPRGLVALLGVDGLLDAMVQDERAHSLIVQTLQEWDGELPVGDDHSREAIRNGLELAIHRRLMKNAAELMIDMHKKFTGHNDWTSEDPDLATEELDRRLDSLSDNEAPAELLTRTVLSILDLMIARGLTTERLIERIAETIAANHPIRNSMLQESFLWRHLVTVISSRRTDHLALLTLLCTCEALNDDSGPRDEVVKMIERALGGTPNYPTPHERIAGLTDRPWSTWRPMRFPRPSDPMPFDFSDIPSIDLLEVEPLHISESTMDITKSLDYDQMPDAVKLLDRLHEATDRRDYAPPRYPPELIAFFAENTSQLQRADFPNCGTLLDIVRTAGPADIATPVRRELEARVLAAAFKERHRRVGSWALRLPDNRAP